MGKNNSKIFIYIIFPRRKCCNNVLVCKFITVFFNISSSQYRSYNFRSFLSLLFRNAVIQNLVAFDGIDNECIITPCFNTIVDLDIPIFQWCAYSLYFCFDRFFDI